MKRLISILTALILVVCSGSYSAFAEETVTETTAPAQTVQLKNGWEVKDGKKRYFIDGVLVKRKVISVDNNWYYFNKKGFLVKGKTVKYNNCRYYLSNKGTVRAYSKGGKFFFANSKQMSKAETEDFKCRLKAEKIAAKITDSSMSKKKKLKVCFNWVMKKYYKTRRKSCNVSYWPAVYANDHFANKGGDCHSDAAAFAYLAAAIGYRNVYVCNDAKYVNPKAHAWTEINGRVYDPLFAQAKSYAKNYNVSYKTYRLNPVIKVNLDYNKNRPKK